jgi:peroxiredoxin Q/BCP
MAQLRRDHEEFSKRDAEILVVGPEGADKFKAYFEKEQLPFTGLPDPKHTVLKLFGQQVKIFKLGRMPAQVLVDMNGIARFVHYGHSMADIPENRELLGLLDRLNQADPENS